MERRELVKRVGSLAAGMGFASMVLASEKGHEHHANPKAAEVKRKTTKELEAVIRTSLDCIRTGEICLALCTDHMATGDKSMADCQRGVMNMLPVCEAMLKVASYNSADMKLIKAYAKVCAEFTRACDRACEEHAQHVVECKDCMLACRECTKACEALVKAA